MKFPLGLFTDSTETNQPEGTYRFAKNIIDSNVIDVKENEDGFVACGALAPYTVNGIIPVGEAFVVFSTDNVDSEIGLVERDNTTLNYTQIYNNPDLEFSTARPIKGEFRVDVNGDRVITWIEIGEDSNVPRILNIDDTSLIDDVNDLAVFQDVQNPSIQSSSINDSGGSLTTGAKILITKYRNRDGSETNWFVHDHVFYINDDSKSVVFQLNDGCDGGLVSNKSISCTFEDTDSRFETLVVGYLQSTNNIVTAVQAVSVTNSNPITVVITGAESSSELSLSEVLTANTAYNNAKAITQLSGSLYYGNLTADSTPDLQEVALDIEINYTSTLTNVISNTNSHKDNLPPGPVPGEVYAYYLGVELNKGGWRFYHIPGRTAVGNETSSVTSEGMTYLRYQINDTSNAIGAATNMGYWENENEVYPSTGGFSSVAGQNVRHHRFPTLDALYNNDHLGSASFGITHLPYLTITASNVNIPVEIQPLIKRWKIFYAKKDVTNSLFTGSDLVMLPALPSQDSNIYWSTGGNWKTTNANSWFSCTGLSANKMRVHSLDYLYNKDTPTPTYGRFIYRLNRDNLDTVYSGFRTQGGKLCESGQVDSDTDGNEVDAFVVDYTTPTYATKPSGAAFIKRLDNFTFVPSNSIAGSVYTMYTEGIFSTDINNPSTAFSFITSTTEEVVVRQKDEGNSANSLDEESSMYVMFYRLLTDVHTSFFSQTVVPTESYALPEDTSLSDIRGGSGFMCYMSFLACGPANSNIELPSDYNKRGIRAWHSYIGYSNYNFNYRNQELGEIGSYYHGKTDVRSLFSPAVPVGATQSNEDMRGHDCVITTTDPQNVVEYNKDFNQINEYVVGTIYDPSIVEETIFPNTIIYSPVQNEETREFSWRTFPAGNRYVMPKNKGEIVNLQGYNNRTLLINHKYSFYRTRTDIKAATEGEDVFYKSVSIFDLPPEELIPTSSGYAGCQNSLSCKLTKAGYFFNDDLQGKAFLFSDGLEEISKNGMRQFFRDFMRLGATNEDNPFNGEGYNAEYDERNNRLIFSKKGSESGNWTISYNPAKKYWTSFHSWIPNYLFSTVDNVTYAIKDSEFYIINLWDETVEKGVYFGEETPESSFIDLVFNPEPTVNKQFVSMFWNTEVYPNTYTNGQPDTTLDYETTFSHVTFRTLDQCTGEIVIYPKEEHDDLYFTNVRNINRNWFLDEIRDIALQTGFTQGFYDDFNLDNSKLNSSMEWHEQRKFTDKFVICRLKFDNTENKRLLFLEASINYRYATRQ